MSNNSHRALWDNCLQLIRQNVTEEQFKTWFEPIVFVSYNEAEAALLLQLPSYHFYDYLEQYYVKLMGWALNHSFQKVVRVSYKVVTDQAHGLAQQVESEGVPPVDTPQSTRRANKAPNLLDAAVPQDLDPQLDKKKSFHSFVEAIATSCPAP